MGDTSDDPMPTGPVSRSMAQHYMWGSGCDGWRLVDRPGLSVTHERMPPGTREERHLHDQAWQVFFVLVGELTIELDGMTNCLGTEEALEVPSGVAHQARNDGDGPVEFLVISAPTTREDRETV